RGPAWLSRARSGAGRAGRADPQGYADRRRAAAAGVHAHLGVGAGGGAAAERPHRPEPALDRRGRRKGEGDGHALAVTGLLADGHDAAVGLVDAAGGGAHDGDVLPGGGEAGDAALLSRRAAGGTLVVGAVPDQLLVADLEASRQAGDAGAGRLLASVAADSAVEERGPLQKRAGRRADGDVAMGIAGVALIAVGRARGELQSERDRSRRAFAAAAGPAAAARPAAATGPRAAGPHGAAGAPSAPVGHLAGAAASATELDDQRCEDETTSHGGLRALGSSNPRAGPRGPEIAGLREGAASGN